MRKIAEILFFRFYIFIFLLPIPAFAQTQSSLQYQKLGLKDGLTDLTVNAIAQDSLGILYFGTENGLSIFDGNSIEKYFSKQGQNSISDNTIYSLMVDHNQRIWIGDSKGVDVYDRRTGLFKQYKINKTEYSVFSIFQDNQNKIWIGTYGTGLCYYEPNLDSIIIVKNPVSTSASVSCITQDLRGNIWFGTEKDGLFFVERNSLTTSSFNNGVEGISESFDFSGLRIRALYPDNYGNMYIGTYDKSLFFYNNKLKKIEKFIPNGYPLGASAHITGIIEDCNGNIWISADGDGLFFYKKENNTLINVNNENDFQYTLSSKGIRKIYFDINNTLWIGTYKSGLNYTFELQRKKFHHATFGYEKTSINSIKGLSENKLLIGTDEKGLYTFDLLSNKRAKVNLNNIASFENILCIHKDKKANYWVGSFLNGLVEIGNSLKPIENLTKESNLLNNYDIRSIETDSNNVFIGTNGGGLNIFNQKSKQISYFKYNYANPDSGIIYDQIRPMLIDSRKYLWIGTKFGITRINTKSRKYINIPSLNTAEKASDITCFYEDKMGIMWIGTSNGLYKLKTSIRSKEISSENSAFKLTNYVFTNYLNKTNGTNIVYSILEDNRGNLWLGTNNGLIKFNIRNEVSTSFYPEHGINMNSFNPESAFESENGTMYFGGNNGFVSFHPDSITDLTIEPNLIISRFFINMLEYNINDSFNNEIVLKKHINYTDKISLKYGSKIISIQFGSTNTFLPGEIEYAYKLDNFDNDWHIISGKNLTATYTNLEPGNYTFMFKARYNVENWNNGFRKLEITILPPFWGTWWFRLLFVIFIIVTLYTIYRIRIVNYRRNNIKLEKLVNAKSKELLTEKEAKLLELENNKQLLIEKQQIERERLLIEKEMQSAQNEKLLTELELKKQIESNIKAELTASLAHISEKNDLFKTIKNELKALLPAKQEIIIEELNKMINQIDSETYFKDDWQKFENNFNVVYADFIHKLKQKFPDLTQKELRLCAYLKMNLSSNEIAQLSNITTRGIEKSRSRLRKKLDLKPDVDLYEYLINSI